LKDARIIAYTAAVCASIDYSDGIVTAYRPIIIGVGLDHGLEFFVLLLRFYYTSMNISTYWWRQSRSFSRIHRPWESELLPITAGVNGL